MSNMGVEIGAKCAIFEADDVTMEWLDGRMKRPAAPVSQDADAVYEAVYTVDVSDLEPRSRCRTIRPTPTPCRRSSSSA